MAATRSSATSAAGEGATKTTARRARTAASLLLLAVTALACGNDHEPPGGLPTPRPTQTAPIPQPTQTGAPSLLPMTLGDAGSAIAVNEREWIVVDVQQTMSVIGFSRQVVLPTDAGPDAASRPRFGCLDPTLPDGSCFHEQLVPLDVADTGWLSGVNVYFSSGGVNGATAVAIDGDDGHAVDLLVGEGRPIASCSVDPHDDVRVGAGPLFLAFLRCGNTVQRTAQPVVWRAPEAVWLTLLPTTGFAVGPRPECADADGRIAGAGLAPELPVLWRLAGNAYTLERLPLLDGGTHGAALGIDVGQIVGWSDDASGAEHAVVWQSGDQGFTVRALPRPDFAAVCTRATSTSAARIGGTCNDHDGRSFGVLWTSSGADAWRVEFLLGARKPGDDAAALDVSGDLAVGWSGSSAQPVPVAWRLPSDAAAGG